MDSADPCPSLACRGHPGGSVTASQVSVLVLRAKPLYTQITFNQHSKRLSSDASTSCMRQKSEDGLWHRNQHYALICHANWLGVCNTGAADLCTHHNAAVAGFELRRELLAGGASHHHCDLGVRCDDLPTRSDYEVLVTGERRPGVLLMICEEVRLAGAD